MQSSRHSAFQLPRAWVWGFGLMERGRGEPQALDPTPFSEGFLGGFGFFGLGPGILQRALSPTSTASGPTPLNPKP